MDALHPEPCPWLHELELLLTRYSELGIGSDVHLMSIDELAGVYRFLAGLHRKAEVFDD